MKKEAEDVMEKKRRPHREGSWRLALKFYF
jgi:hypothetical protein